MIIIHEGVPGSGKSYDAVRKIIDALKRGRVVYTNIDGMDTDSCLEYISSYVGMTRGDLSDLLRFIPNSVVPQFWEHVEHGSFIVIDEAQLYFNSRDFTKTENREFGSWASTHRHHGYDVLLITQRAERIDTAVRSLAEFRYRYRKLNVFGSLVQKGYLIYTHAGEDPKHLSWRKATYDSTVFPCYQSYVGDATEKKVVKVPNLLNHPLFYGLAFVLCLTFYFGSKSPLLSGKLIDTKAITTNPLMPGQKKAPVEKLPLKKAEKAPAIAVPEPLDSVDDSLVALPLTGVVEVSDGRVFLMTGSYRLSRWVDYDRDLMVVWVKPEFVPPGLTVALY